MTVEDEGFEPIFEEINEKPKKKKKQVKGEEPKEVITPAKSSKKKSKQEKQEDEKLEVEKPASKKKSKKESKEEKLDEEPAVETKKKKSKGKKEKHEAPEAKNEDEAITEVKEKTAKKRKASENNDQKPSKKTKKEQNKKEVKLDDYTQKLLEKLKDTRMAFQVREILGKEVASGSIDENTSQLIFQQWRKANKTSDFDRRAKKIINMEGTQAEVQAVIDQLVKKRLLRPNQARDILFKWGKREGRRVGRQEETKQRKFCFKCRQNGHLVTECPEKEAGNETNEMGICFKCGSGEHSVHKCPKKHVKGYPFATCFVCKEQGHLSKDCEKNPNGIYPDGGSCSVCGSQMHLKRDCPDLAAQKKKSTDNKKVSVRAMTAESRPDEEDIEEAEVTVEKPKKKKGKVVKF